MDDTIRSLYEQELNVQKEQCQQFKELLKKRDETISSLIDQVRNLKDFMGKAQVANQDLHTAFEHVREENLQLQLRPQAECESWNQQPARPDSNQDKEIELAQQSVSWLSQRDKLCQKVMFLERECHRYEQENATLGLQVRHLLRTLEEERGMIIRRANDHEIPNKRQMTAVDVIDRHLVTFESVEELQRQNQKLLSLVKDLSERDEEQTLHAENDDIKRLNTELAELRSHLENVKTDRERIMNAFNTIMKERDLFKILLSKTRQVEHMTPEIFQRMVSIACACGPGIEAQADSQDRDAHITDLKAMISRLEQELSDLKAEMETLRRRSSDETKLKGEMLEQAHLKILDETKRAEVLLERNEVIESNIKTLEAELDEMRTRSQKLTFENEQLTDKIEEERQRHSSEVEQLSMLLEQERSRQSELSDILSEMRGKISAIEHNSGEIKNHIENVAVSAIQNQDDLLNQANLAQADSRDKDAHIAELNAIISRLEQELSDLRSEMETQQHRSSDEVKLKDEMLEQAHQKILDETKRAEVLLERNEVIESNIKTLEAELDELRTRSQKFTFEIEQLTGKIEEERQRHSSEVEQLSMLLEQERSRQSELSNILSEMRGKISAIEHNSGEIKDNMENVAVSEVQNQDDLLNQANLAQADSRDKDAPITELNAIISRLEQELSDPNVEMEAQPFRGPDEMTLESEITEQTQDTIDEVPVTPNTDSLVQADPKGEPSIKLKRHNM